MLRDAGMNLFLAGTQPLSIVFLSRTTGLDAGSIGVLIALVGTGGVPGGAVASRRGSKADHG
ncbi:hypothetical protein OG244_06365 [Streptomyces brevispora]|uniref:hypothetical protein n=1 Tax=Streptomyces brevispora TaxID=887462 RepID=UPI002E332AFC|nr:hypothetical protein [Streptomyces brevispora]